jgi:hypothetical protein
MADKTYTVTVASGSLYGGGTGNVFYVDGVRNATGPGEIDWVQGATLRFEQSDSSNNNHPLLFTTDASAPNSYRISAGVSYYLDGASDVGSYTNTSLFNAATTRYVEITPANNVDFFYYCYVHGIGMGGPIDLVQNAWGALNWSQGAWQDQGNSGATLTGIGTTFSLGSVSVSGVVAEGWSNKEWGESLWGNDSNDTPIPTGVSLSTNLGSVSVTAVVAEGWGRLNWNESAWGQAGTILLTGNPLSASLGSVSITSEVNTGWGREAWGDEPWNENTAVQNVDVTGQEVTTNLGSVSISGEINLGWGRKAWNEQEWGTPNESAQPTGFNLSASLGSVSITAEVNSGWGRTNWGELGWGIPGTLIPTGVSMSASLGTVTAVAEVNIGWGRKEWGQGLWNNDGDDLVIPTGFGMNVVQGLPSIDTEINTGWGRAAWGELDWGGFSDSIVVGVSGNPITVSLNSVLSIPNTIATPTGINTTINLGTLDIDADANITVSGNSLTAATGSLNAIIWNQVDTGTAPTWKNVDTAA